jgi:hypothetical protein
MSVPVQQEISIKPQTSGNMELETAYENHIRTFFTARLPGNESNFNFTEILANFPFMLEWVIRNRPAKSVEIYFETSYVWWDFNSGYGYSNAYDLNYITAHSNATPELIMKYPDFDWSVPVIKYKFRDAMELEVLATLLQKPENLGIPAMSKFEYDKIVNFKPVVAPIDIPNRLINEVYIPALLASDGNMDYIHYPPGYQAPVAAKKPQNPYLCDVAFAGGRWSEVARENSPFTIRQFGKSIWDACSFNPLVPWEFIDRHRKLPWTWNLVFRSPRFAPQFFMTPEGEQQAWDGGVLSGYRRLTFELIEYLEHKKYKLDWTIISYCDFSEEKVRFYANYSNKQCNTNRSISLGLNRAEVKLSEIARSRPAAADLAAQVIACYPEASKIICLTLGSDAVLGYMCSRDGETPRDLLIIDAKPLKSIDGHQYPDYARFEITDSRGYDFIRAEIKREPFIFVSVEPLAVSDIYEIFMGDIPVNGRVISLFD